MKDSDEILDAKQESALCALLASPSIKEAAKRAKVSETTLWRLLQLPEFQRRYRAARRQLVESAIAQLQSDCVVAVKVLREVAEDTEAPASARVSAAKTIIEQSISAIELVDLQERVEELERRLKPDGEARKTA